MKKKPSFEVPFDADGNLSYDGHEWRDQPPLTWREPFEFEATLTYEAYGRGNSAAYFHFKDQQGHRYTMLMTDFNDIMLSGGFDGRRVTGVWTFAKRGYVYGVKLVRRI